MPEVSLLPFCVKGTGPGDTPVINAVASLRGAGDGHCTGPNGGVPSAGFAFLVCMFVRLVHRTHGSKACDE